MIPQQSNDRFWDSTRGRIVVLLRRGDCIVNDLAKALDVTDNAVRAHLASLGRDGLVRQSGTRRGTRKPNLTYGLTAEAERLFPKIYGSILGHFLDVLKGRLPPDEVDAFVRAIGHQMAPHLQPRVQTPDLREKAAAVLHRLGGFCDSDGRNGTIVFRCSDCPLAAVVVSHPEVCRLVETVLADILGVAVKERCKPPQCLFEISAAGDHSDE